MLNRIISWREALLSPRSKGELENRCVQQQLDDVTRSKGELENRCVQQQLDDITRSKSELENRCVLLVHPVGFSKTTQQSTCCKMVL